MPAFIFFLSAASLVSAVLVFWPSIALISGILWGVIFIMAGLYLSSDKVLIIGLLNMAIILILAGPGSLLYYMAFYGLTAGTMGILVAHNKGYYDLQKWGMLVAVIGVSGFLLLMYLNTGGIGINELEKEILAYLQQSFQFYEDIGYFEIYQRMGISQAEIEQMLNDMVRTFARHLPAIYYIQAVLTVFFMLLFSYFLSRKRNFTRLKKRPYKNEIMPWQLVWLVIIALGLWIWGREEANSIYYLGSNILVAMIPVMLYYGLSFILSKIGEKKGPAKIWWSIGLIILSILFTPSAIIFVCISGLFDSLVDFRKLRIEQEE